MSWMDDLKATCVECGTKCLVCPCKKLLRGVRQFLHKLVSFILAPKCILCPFVKSFKSLWQRLCDYFWQHEWALYTLLMLFGLVACNFAVVHLYLAVLKQPPAVTLWIPDIILWWWLDTSASELLKIDSYGTIITDMIAICAFVFAVFPIVQYRLYKRKLKRKLREEYGFDFVPVKKAGYDDIEEMLKRYKQADKVTIFSGGFDWIRKNEDMKKLLLKLAGGGKLILISFRKYDKVKELFAGKGEASLFDELHGSLKKNFRFDSGLDGIKCSLIETIGEKRLLFRQSSEQHEFNAGFLGSSKYSRQLLGILFRFADVEERGKPFPEETD